MKKLFFLLFVVLFSCSSDDEVNPQAITPPDWIQGTWKLQAGNTTIDNGFTFTSNDVISFLS